MSPDFRPARLPLQLCLVILVVSTWTSPGSPATRTHPAAPVAGPQRPGVAGATVDWPQWRGPGRDGHAGLDLPDSWPTPPRRLWRVEVGIGHSSPVVQGERVWQLAREDDREVLRALDLASGETLWVAGHEVPYTMHPAARGHGKGPKSTPALADGRVVTLGIAGALTAWDADTGEVIWRHDFADRFESTAPAFGAAMSPIVLGDRVIAHVGGHGDGSLAAFDLASGRPEWSLDGYGPGYASPVLIDVDGAEQLVTQAEAHVIGLDPEDGELLWRLPFRTDHDQNVVTPLAVGSRLILSGLGHGVFAVRPERDDGEWSVRELWRNEEVSLYMSSPVAAAGRVLGMSHRRAGQFFALDPADGSLLWRSRGREGDNAALVVVDGRVLFLTDDARLVVVDATAAEYQPLADLEVADSATWAHPVPTARGLLIKDLEGLTLWDLGGGAGQGPATPR